LYFLLSSILSFWLIDRIHALQKTIEMVQLIIAERETPT
jgi:hypothetical protein